MNDRPSFTPASLGDHHRNPRWPMVLAVLLLPLVAFLLVDGFGTLLGHPLIHNSGPGDLHLRWVEEACVRAGKSPYEVMIGRVQPPAAGIPEAPDYPPWGLTFGLLFTLPGWDATRLLFIAWNVAALATLAGFAAYVLRIHGWQWAMLAAVSLLAVGANRSALVAGQYSIIICALLAVSLLTAGRGGWEWLGGLALGIALLKFSISLPFCVCFLVTGRWRTLVMAGTLVVAAALANWGMIHVPPWVTFAQAADVGVRFATSSPMPLKLAVKLGLSSHQAAMVVAVVLAALGAVVIWFNRHRSMLTLFAVAALFARFWALHFWYDDVMMGFVLLALLARLAAVAPTDHRAGTTAMFLLVGLSLWATVGIRLRWPFVLCQNIAWTAGVVCLLLSHHPSVSSGPIKRHREDV